MINYTKDICAKILSDPTLAGLIGIFGISLSYWGVYRALRGRRLSYRRIDIPILKPLSDSCKLNRIIKEPTKTMFCSEVAIWNSGKKYINCSDMARKEPLRVIVQNDSKILAGELLFSTCEYCDVSCKMNQNQTEMIIDFDYLECGEGCIVSVIYEGEKEDLKVLGVIKGKAQIETSQSILDVFKKQKIVYDLLTSKVFSWVVIFFCFFMCPVAYLQSGNFWYIDNNFFNIPDTLGGRIFDIFVIAVLFVFTVGISIPFWIRLFTPRFPKDLETHFGK